MNTWPRWPLAIVGVGLLLLLAFGCAVPAGYGGYYEPYGVSYGGWGVGYGVGPWRGGGIWRGYGRPVVGRPAFRPPPAGRAMPSIPSRVGARGPARGGRR